jgi:hypothetical protein
MVKHLQDDIGYVQRKYGSMQMRVDAGSEQDWIQSQQFLNGMEIEQGNKTAASLVTLQKKVGLLLGREKVPVGPEEGDKWRRILDRTQTTLGTLRNILNYGKTDKQAEPPPPAWAIPDMDFSNDVTDGHTAGRVLRMRDSTTVYPDTKKLSSVDFKLFLAEERKTAKVLEALEGKNRRIVGYLLGKKSEKREGPGYGVGNRTHALQIVDVVLHQEYLHRGVRERMAELALDELLKGGWMEIDVDAKNKAKVLVPYTHLEDDFSRRMS